MPTNDERRALAARLRGMANVTLRGEDSPALFVEELDYQLFDEIPNTPSDIARRLADLIEPEERTCRVIMKWDGLDGRDPVCSKCDTYFDDEKWHELKFCPNCGAKVVQQ